jgi:hypothetical protein
LLEGIFDKSLAHAASDVRKISFHGGDNFFLGLGSSELAKHRAQKGHGYTESAQPRLHCPLCAHHVIQDVIEDFMKCRNSRNYSKSTPLGEDQFQHHILYFFTVSIASILKASHGQNADS